MNAALELTPCGAPEQHVLPLPAHDAAADEAVMRARYYRQRIKQ